MDRVSVDLDKLGEVVDLLTAMYEHCFTDADSPLRPEAFDALSAANRVFGDPAHGVQAVGALDASNQRIMQTLRELLIHLRELHLSARDATQLNLAAYNETEQRILDIIRRRPGDDPPALW